jgi:hypothetical protein
MSKTKQPNILPLVAFMAASVLCVIGAALLLADLQWSPGQQDAIAREYRQRCAVEVASK